MTADELIQAIDNGLKAMEKQKDNPFVPSVVLRIGDYKMILAELEKKDRIIHKMAERLTTDIHSKEWVIDYYEREVEK